jgi:hypothetical protein
VGPRAGLDTEAIGKILSPLPGIEPQSPGRSLRMQTLYYLSYPSTYFFLRRYKCFKELCLIFLILKGPYIMILNLKVSGRKRPERDVMFGNLPGGTKKNHRELQ